MLVTIKHYQWLRFFSIFVTLLQMQFVTVPLNNKMLMQKASDLIEEIIIVLILGTFIILSQPKH